MHNDIPGFGCVSKLGYPPSLNENAICFSKNLPIGFQVVLFETNAFPIISIYVSSNSGAFYHSVYFNLGGGFNFFICLTKMATAQGR